MEKNEILMIHGKDYKEMTKRLLREAELDTRIPDRRCRIGIKPNLVSPTEASYGATTHPEIIAGILEYLQERNYENLVILEAPGWETGLRRLFRCADMTVWQSNTG